MILSFLDELFRCNQLPSIQMCENPDDPKYSQLSVNEDIEFIKPEQKLQDCGRLPIPFRRKFSNNPRLTQQPEENQQHGLLGPS